VYTDGAPLLDCLDCLSLLSLFATVSPFFEEDVADALSEWILDHKCFLNHDVLTGLVTPSNIVQFFKLVE
jgi:hypothetical protein